MLGCSAKEWALNMVREDCELDTLALIAIRNMLDVSLLNLLNHKQMSNFVTHAIRKPCNLKIFKYVIRKRCNALSVNAVAGSNVCCWAR